MRRHEGFTLVELLVASTILLLVMVYVTQAFSVQQKTYIVVDQVTEAQQNLRAVADLMERDIRLAGYMVPSHAAVCGWDNPNIPDRLFVSNADVIRSVFALEGGNEDLAGNFGAPVSGVTSAWTLNPGSVSFSLTRLWVDVAADGADFTAGSGVIIADRRDPAAIIACGRITSITGNTLSVYLANTHIGPVGLNADVVAIPAHEYAVTYDAENNGTLSRDDMVLAQQVEDFQLTFYFDLDDDLEVDAGERFNDAGTTPYAFEGAVTNIGSLADVQINLVTRTREDDPNRDWSLGAGQVVGNRTAATLASSDGKRRRVYSSRIRLRNATS